MTDAIRTHMRTLIEVAEMTQHRTEAAADLVSSPDQLPEALKSAPFVVRIFKLSIRAGGPWQALGQESGAAPSGRECREACHETAGSPPIAGLQCRAGRVAESSFEPAGRPGSPDLLRARIPPGHSAPYFPGSRLSRISKRREVCRPLPVDWVARIRYFGRPPEFLRQTWRARLTDRRTCASS